MSYGWMTHRLHRPRRWFDRCAWCGRVSGSEKFCSEECEGVWLLWVMEWAVG